MLSQNLFAHMGNKKPPHPHQSRLNVNTSVLGCQYHLVQAISCMRRAPLIGGCDHTSGMKRSEKSKSRITSPAPSAWAGTINAHAQ